MNALPYIKSNLEALAAVKNPAAIWLAQQRPDEQAVMDNLITNHWKLLDWKLPEGQGLFDAFHPGMLYQGWAQDADDAGANASIIVGCNLGYGLNHVLVNSPANHMVLVIEPDPAILLACLGQTDYAPFIQAGKLHFLPPQKKIVTQAVQKLDMHFLFGRINLRSDSPSRQLGPEYAQWTRFCQESLEWLAVELTTLRRCQDIMVRNELQNFRKSRQQGNVKTLANTAQGLTAVILGAGPSLEVHGPQLAKDRGYALYASALQNLPALAKVGIKPDMLMAIDYSKGMLRCFNNLTDETLQWVNDVPLLYSTKVDPEVLERYPGPKIPFWTLGGLGTYTLPESEKPLDAGGNVSVALYRMLHRFGIERILLCGQDFAWKNQQSHATGHHSASSQRKNVVHLSNLQGERISSTLSYTTALHDMERDIAEIGLPTFNLYGGYAVIRGAVNVDVEQVKRDGLHTSTAGSLERFLKALRAAQTPGRVPAIEPRYPLWAPSLRNAQRHLEKLFKKSHSRQKEIREAIARFHTFLRHDPMYLPYLYNEITDVVGLLHGGRSLGPKDFVTFKQIIKRVQHKVRDMDELIADKDFHSKTGDQLSASSRQAA